MTTPSRAIDDLDRLAFRLRRLIREQHPQLATHGFTLRDLEEQLLPFRDARREMADGSAEAWERVMLRLLAGEREVIAAELTLQEACRQALAMPSPTLALIRGWSANRLMLGASTATPTSSAAFGAPLATRHPCRFCGGGLPEGRTVTFCPHCGLDLTTQQCPACSTELAIDWRFCVTCGRATGLAVDPDAGDGRGP